MRARARFSSCEKIKFRNIIVIPIIILDYNNNDKFISSHFKAQHFKKSKIVIEKEIQIEER